jgi:hypothetical protein
MRESLAQHLRSSLRDHGIFEVREEQNVDESHPVDIKVTWSFTNNLALIEIKWLGQSVNAMGDGMGTRYGESRAREGAKQLADYLDGNLQRAPLHQTRGYLIVFDARREGLSFPPSITLAEARAYWDRDIEYDPRYDVTRMVRNDFAPPLRFYLEPAVAA